MSHVKLPNKLYFRIGEVARIVGVKPHVLRYWETEFPLLRPGKTPARHRLYRRRDVEVLLEIKRLLKQEGFTIAGAKKQLKEGETVEPFSSAPLPPPSPPPPQPPGPHDALYAIRKDLQALQKMLAEDVH